jgi:F420H(2)-dependent quinone reductase
LPVVFGGGWTDEGQELTEIIEAEGWVDRRPAWRSHLHPQQAPPAVEGPPGMSLEGEYVPSSSAWVREQVEAYERAGGQEANTLRDTGLPVIVVTMRGNKTGKVRKIAVMRVTHNGEYALVASKGGAPKHPVWYYNLEAHPDEVIIQDGPEPFEARVRQVTGEERAAWWERAVAAYPPYAEYQKKTEREIPVFVASRKS